MQDSSLYSHIQAQVQQQQPLPPQFPEQEQLKCPRCDSTNTKFCYYNNYNLSQPRHFCKSCKRYWTKGGALRNIPVGGGSRKNSKRSSSSSSSSASAAANKRPAAAASVSASKCKRESENINSSGEIAENFGGQFENFLEMSGSFTSLLGAGGDQYAGLLDGSGFVDPGSGQDVNPGGGDGFLNMQGGGSGGGGGDSGDWGGGAAGNEWPDLAIYTPGSTFQ